MATKKPARKASKSVARQPFEPQAADAIRIATLRWYTTTMEQLLVQIYATDRRKYRDLEKLMKAQVRAIQAMGTGGPNFGDEDCPDGWTLCKDGLCSPMCGGVED